MAKKKNNGTIFLGNNIMKKTRKALNKLKKAFVQAEKKRLGRKLDGFEIRDIRKTIFSHGGSI